jgi:hypothetical protein
MSLLTYRPSAFRVPYVSVYIKDMREEREMCGGSYVGRGGRVKGVSFWGARWIK